MTSTRARTASTRLAVACLAGLLLAGCGGASDSATSGADAGAPAAGGGGGAAVDEDAGSGSGSDAGSGSGSAVTVPERKITRSQVTVEVDDLSRSAQQVRDLAAANGGEVTDESLGLSQTYDDLGSSSYGSDGGGIEGVDVSPVVIASPGEARLVLRVPPEAAEETVNEIAALGTETGRWTSSTSVETTLVDLESRIESQTKAVEQAQELLERATSLQDIVLLENEVNTRTTELESLKSRLASVEGQSDRATVTAVLQTRERTEQVASTAGFLGGLRAGWNALQASVGVLLTVVGAVLPFAVVAVLIGYPVYRLTRRRRANRPPVLAPAGPPAGWATARSGRPRRVRRPTPRRPAAPGAAASGRRAVAAQRSTGTACTRSTTRVRTSGSVSGSTPCPRLAT